MRAYASYAVGVYGLAVTNRGRVDFDRIFVEDHEAVKSKFVARIKTWIGEYNADLRAGVDAELLIGSLVSLGLASEEVYRVAREIPEVTDVEVTEISAPGTRYPVFEVLLNNGGQPVTVDLADLA